MTVSLQEHAVAATVDVAVESALWDGVPDAVQCVERAIATAARACGATGEVAVMLADDATLRALNARWRGRDAPTNVLSFPAPPALRVPPLAGEGRGGGEPKFLGDIAIAFETTRREAEAEGKTILHHLSHLAVHGFLHLLGYDHESDAEAERMERLERSILAELDIADPYDARDHA
jgi:probable rRNA maturation factor